MRFPWANLILLALLIIQLISGYLGFVSNEPAERWLLWLHGIVAYAIVILFLWKGSIIWETIGRRKTWTRQRISFLVLLGLLLLTVIFGLLWSFGPQYLAGFSLLTLHIFLAVPLMLLMAFHAWRLRWIVRVPGAVDRRLFLRSAVLGLAGGAAWWLSGRLSQALALPGSERRFTGSYEVGSFGGRFPVTSWINDNPRPVDVQNWRLQIDGAVGQPYTLDYEQLLALPQEEVMATLDCTGGFYTTQVWRGVRLGQLLETAGLKENGRSVTVESVTGYRRRFPLEDAAGYLLAFQVTGEALPHGHGFPVRLVASDQRGFAWVKWVTRLHVNTTSAIWQSPLPLQ